MIDLLPTDPVKRGRAKLLMLAAFFAVPVFGGYAAYFLGLAPGVQANYGELITPQPLPDPELQQRDGSAMKLSELRGKWLMVQFDSGACDAWCEKKLYYMRQIRTAQGKDAPRLERVWLLTDSEAPKAPLLAAIDGTRIASAGPLQKIFPGVQSDHLYMVDPQGNLMMRFPRDLDPSRMIRDLQRLLKYSRTG